MYKSVILPLAKKDIQETALWYNKRSKGLGKRFAAAVREKVRFIRQNPEAVGIRYDKVRTSVLNIFPYMIHYTIDKSKQAVVISAVLHTSRHPEVWKER